MRLIGCVPNVLLDLLAESVAASVIVTGDLLDANVLLFDWWVVALATQLSRLNRGTADSADGQSVQSDTVSVFSHYVYTNSNRD